MNEPIKVIAGILRKELNLAADQVILYNQKFDIPTDDRMYIYVSLLGTRTFGSNVGYDPDPVTGDLVETVVTNRQEMISIHAYSRSSEARLRSWEVAASLVSTFSQQEQEANSIKIGTVPTSMADLSDLEGTSRLNRYALTFMVLAAYKKQKPVDYFDTFRQPQLFTNP